MKDIYCDCGQYLTKYFEFIFDMTTSPVTVSGVPCPGKDCNRSYTIEAKMPEEQ